MNEYLANRWFKIGFRIALVGWSPLLFAILLGVLGLWPDANPIGFGLLFAVSFWPAIICMIVGVVQTRRAST